jgi:hypothetical protein
MLAARLRRKLIDDGGVPGVVDQELAGKLRPAAHHAQGKLLVIGGRGRIAGVAQIRLEGHHQIDDLDAAPAARREEAPVHFDHRSRPGDVEAGEVEHAALRDEGILHVQDDERRAPEIDVDRLRPRLQHGHDAPPGESALRLESDGFLFASALLSPSAAP